MFSPASFKITEGEDKLLVYEHNKTTSGNTAQRHFCGRCGAAIFIQSPQRPDMVVIVGGSLDDYDEFVPQREGWTSGRVGWMKALEGTECFAEALGTSRKT